MVHQCSRSLHPDSSSISKGRLSSSVTALGNNTGFLLRQARRPLLHLARALSFSVCVHGRFCDLSLTFRKVFTSNASNNLVQSLEINTLEEMRIEAVFNRFPSFTTSHECPKMSISIVTPSSGSDQELRPNTVWCVVRTHDSSRLVSFFVLLGRTSNSASAQNGS